MCGMVWGVQKGRGRLLLKWALLLACLLATCCLLLASLLRCCLLAVCLLACLLLACLFDALHLKRREHGQTTLCWQPQHRL